MTEISSSSVARYPESMKSHWIAATDRE